MRCPGFRFSYRRCWSKDCPARRRHRGSCEANVAELSDGTQAEGRQGGDKLVINRLDRISAEIGATITDHIQGDGIASCARCNSHIPYRHLMLRDWNWKSGPTCPNCGTRLDLAAQEAAAIADAVPTPSVLGHERFCPNCGGAYQHMVTDVRSGEIRPARFCPHCGRSLLRPSPEPPAD